MTRFPVPAFFLALAFGATTIRAQTPEPRPIVLSALPRTPAGTALRAWLDAYNSGDSTQMAAYLRTYQPERTVGDALYFRRMTGGFDLLTIERSAGIAMRLFGPMLIPRRRATTRMTAV